jgi:hypothetical protein
MSNELRPNNRTRTRLLVTIVVITLGLAITVFFGARAAASFRQLQYIHQHGLDRGTASVEAVRPWMTIRFIAVAYAVPEEYLYAQLDIPFDRRNANRTLRQLNSDYGLGFSPNSTTPVIIERVKAAITAYRKNPVATGLHDVRPWMSIHYIANSTGMSAQHIFNAIGLSASGNENKPLDLLSKEQNYPGGPAALVDAVKGAIAKPKVTP